MDLDTKILELEAKACFDFFWDSKHTNTNKNSKGYGLVIDRTNRLDMSSIASVGFALSAYVIGVERGYITYDAALERVKGTLKTVYENVPHYKGFLMHFVHMETAERYRNSEISTIDTAILLNGALTADSYFDDPEVHDIVKKLYDRVEWNHFVVTLHGKKVFRMAYNPDTKEFIHYWNMPAEQLMMYILAAAHHSIDQDTALELYNSFERYAGGYRDYQFIFTPGGALFCYQYSQAWFKFQDYVDEHGFNWFTNSVNATLANRAWCIDHKHIYKTFHENSWGLTACDYPNGYHAFGPEPLGWNHKPEKHNTDGTVAPNALCGSVPFTPKECIDALNYLYHNHPKLWGEYGFKDSYNLEEEPWYCDNYLGIDKGISLLGIDNYLHGTTWKYYMKHPLIQKAIEILKFRRRS